MVATQYTGVLSPLSPLWRPAEVFAHQYRRRQDRQDIRHAGSRSAERLALLEPDVLLRIGMRRRRRAAQQRERHSEGVVLLRMGAGSHHLVFGYDYFNDNIIANTHASGSDYRIRGMPPSIVRGDQIFPVFDPGSTTLDRNPLRSR